jgi:hypothetical protein
MTTITLDEIKSDQARLAEKIAAFERVQPRVIAVAAASISLAEGETYVGLILNDDGTPSHHLLLLPGETEANWADAKDWAAKAGGELPTRREQSLLFTNAKASFQARYYWSSEAHENGSGAWVQDFDYGGQGWSSVFFEYCARAVRRFPA